MTQLISDFFGHCQEADGEPYHVTSAEEVLPLITSFIAVNEPPIIWPRSLAESLGITTFLTRPQSDHPCVSITAADFGIASTGSLVSDLTNKEHRVACSIADIHVVLLAAHNILPSLPDALKRYHPVPPYLAITTGPSRTGDIECTLTIGAHGPRRLVVIVVDQEDFHD